eukprot:362782-Chlamydomonas_euryale.AAC.6
MLAYERMHELVLDIVTEQGNVEGSKLDFLAGPATRAPSRQLGRTSAFLFFAYPSDHKRCKVWRGVGHVQSTFSRQSSCNMCSTQLCGIPHGWNKPRAIQLLRLLSLLFSSLSWWAGCLWDRHRFVGVGVGPALTDKPVKLLSLSSRAATGAPVLLFHGNVCQQIELEPFICQFKV